MFADPQSVTYATVSKSLPATGRSSDQSDYKGVFADAEYQLRLAHTFKSARNRVVARLQRTAIVDDPLTTSNKLVASATATITVDFPSAGMTLSQARDLAAALRDWATDANLLKLVGGET